jgi:hypothetical protein
MVKEFKADAMQALLGLLENNRQQFLLQREVLDRWFRFYLIIVAAALATLGAVVNAGAICLNTPEHRMYVGLASMLLCILGLAFFYMNTVQRANSVDFIRFSINPIEVALWNKWSDLLSLKSREFRVNRWGADFAVGLVIAITNAGWLVGAIHFLSKKSDGGLCLSIVTFLIALVIQMALRFIYLVYISKAENVGLPAAQPGTAPDSGPVSLNRRG